MRKKLFILAICIALTVGASIKVRHIQAFGELSKAEKNLDTAHRYIKQSNESKADAYLESAIQTLRSIGSGRQNDPKFHFLVGKYYYLRNDFSSKYYKHFDLSGEYKKDAAKMFNDHGHRLLKNEEYVRAFLEFRDACIYNPDNCDNRIVPIYIDYSRRIARNGQLNEGIRYIEILAERYPNESAILSQALYDMSHDLPRPLDKIKLLTYSDKIDPGKRIQVAKQIKEIVGSHNLRESQAVNLIAAINPQLADSVQQQASYVSENRGVIAGTLEERNEFTKKMKASFPGVWKNNFNNVFTFNPDGTCIVKTSNGIAREGTWDIIDKKLIMKNSKDNKTYTHEVILYTGDRYTLKGEKENYYGKRIK